MSQIQIESIKCINGCEFFPKILPDGTVKKYDRCRVCRIYLNRERVAEGIKKRKKHLVAGGFGREQVQKHPECKICKITLWDDKVLQKHNERLHK